MNEIRFTISTEDLIEELQDDCKELERELVKTKTKFRCILYGSDGKTYVSGAYGVYNSLKQIIPIFGNPSKINPIKVKVGTRKLKTGKESLILTVVK